MYIIERNIRDVGKLNSDQLKGICQTSCSVLKELGSEIQWKHSYVTGDKIYCLYTAPNEEMVYEHAKKGSFLANSVSKVTAIIDPSTAEQLPIHPFFKINGFWSTYNKLLISGI